MPDHLRALVVILVLAGTVFAFARTPACAAACTRTDYARRRNLWIALTLAAFLAHHFWIYIAVAAALLLRARAADPRAASLVFFVLLAVPQVSSRVPGFGVFTHLFEMDYLRLLALAVLLPEYFALRGRPGVQPFGRTLPDKFLLCFLVLKALVIFGYSTNVTVTLRHGFFYAFVDAFLPYYVFSRAPRDLPAFRDLLMSFVVGALALSAILAFEHLRTWLLYATLEPALGINWGWNNYLPRDGRLRAAGASGHPIVAGCIVAVAFGFALYLYRLVPAAPWVALGFLLLAAGIIAPVSRGPWVGAAAMALVFAATGPAPGRSLLLAGLLALLAIPLLLVTGAGGSIARYLPFVGDVETNTIEGRQLLIALSWQLFWQHPILGRYDFMENPILEALRDGMGLIDIVNTYAAVALSHGAVGLALFAGVFASSAFGIWRGIRSCRDAHDERGVLGRSLLATLTGVLVIIGTVSPVLSIPFIYWSLAGLGVAYVRMVRAGVVASPQPPEVSAGARAIRPGPVFAARK